MFSWLLPFFGILFGTVAFMLQQRQPADGLWPATLGQTSDGGVVTNE